MDTSIAHPFIRSGGDFASVSGDAETLAQVGQVLGTPLGSLPWRMDFGSDLHRLRHQGNNPVLRETASVFVGDAIKKWVPKATVVRVSIAFPEANQIDLTVIVQIGTKQQSLTQRL